MPRAFMHRADRGNSKMRHSRGSVTAASLVTVILCAGLSAPASARTIVLVTRDALCIANNVDRYLSLLDDPVLVVQGSCPDAIENPVRGHAGPVQTDKPKAIVLRKAELACVAHLIRQTPPANLKKKLLKFDLRKCPP